MGAGAADGARAGEPSRCKPVDRVRGVQSARVLGTGGSASSLGLLRPALRGGRAGEQNAGAKPLRARDLRTWRRGGHDDRGLHPEQARGKRDGFRVDEHLLCGHGQPVEDLGDEQGGFQLAAVVPKSAIRYR